MAVPDTHFIEEFGETLKLQCLQDELPFCEVACPFHLPVRRMEEKWENGRFNAAYRDLQNAVAFPAIVNAVCARPCEKACVLRERGGALSLGELEKACIRLAKRTAPNSYNLPKKAGRIAVIGGGLAGLGCTLRLANKKYDVTLYEKAPTVGGRARGMMDAALFDAEILNQFREEHPHILCSREVTDLSEILSEADAVFIATGAGGERFGILPSREGAFAGNVRGVFLGGELSGAADPVYALSQGLRAAAAVERYLKTGLMNEPADTTDTRLIIDPKFVPFAAAVTPADPKTGYTAEEAAEEAKRCRKCSCDICRKECDLMRIQQKTPGRLYEEAYITVRPSTLANDGRWATRRIASCDQCGLCKTVCPQRIDMGKFLMQSHRGLKDTHAMPWAFHDYWLRDMEHAVGEAGAVIRKKAAESEKAGCSWVFFPGCQFGASDPDLAVRIADWFFEKQPDGAVWLSCCGAPAVWAAEDERQAAHVAALQRQWEELGRPSIVFACPSCRKMFERYLPQIPARFLEEVIPEWGMPDKAGTGQEQRRFAVFDPCASRDYPALQTAVRTLADLVGAEHEDLSHTDDTVRCCSYGGQYSIAAPDYAKRVRMERAAESELPYITSCMNCRDTFASHHKENVHILDMVFGDGNSRRVPPRLTERRENRMRVKTVLQAKYCGTAPERKEKDMRLICSEALKQTLSDRYILMSDMEQVIERCERTHSGVCHADGSVTGHLKFGHMTYWATWRTGEDGTIELVNGYAHRMNLEGE